MLKKVAVLTGAGISAESGIKTFRDADGLWENYRVEEVATPEAWEKNRKLVLDFYNQRRKQAQEVQPNGAHLFLAALENQYDVNIITQNIDDLHERAGSANIVHLHGEVSKARSTIDPSLVYDIRGWELNEGDLCEWGSQLRPHIVWFGEAVPMMEKAISITESADILIVIGTSMAVYPAAGLVHFARPEIPVFIVDPKMPEITLKKNWTFIKEKATDGVKTLAQKLIQTS